MASLPGSALAVGVGTDAAVAGTLLASARGETPAVGVWTSGDAKACGLATGAAVAAGSAATVAHDTTKLIDSASKA